MKKIYFYVFLAFNLNKDSDFANLAFTPERNNYGSREKVVSQVKLTDSDGTPLEGSFAVSVTDAGAVFPDTTNTILVILSTVRASGSMFQHFKAVISAPTD